MLWKKLYITALSQQFSFLLLSYMIPFFESIP